jgi:hypothetical protein
MLCAFVARLCPFLVTLRLALATHRPFVATQRAFLAHRHPYLPVHPSFSETRDALAAIPKDLREARRVLGAPSCAFRADYFTSSETT